VISKLNNSLSHAYSKFAFYRFHYLIPPHRPKLDSVCSDECYSVELFCSVEYVLHVGGLQFLFNVADLCRREHV
jgi:hypothetical protein